MSELTDRLRFNDSNTYQEQLLCRKMVEAADRIDEQDERIKELEEEISEFDWEHTNDIADALARDADGCLNGDRGSPDTNAMLNGSRLIVKQAKKISELEARLQIYERYERPDIALAKGETK